MTNIEVSTALPNDIANPTCSYVFPHDSLGCTQPVAFSLVAHRAGPAGDWPARLRCVACADHVGREVKWLMAIDDGTAFYRVQVYRLYGRV